MKAAVVTSFDVPPQYADFPAPAPGSADEVVVDVLAAGLHPRVRSQANGSHYTSTDELPLVPGIDGVGRGRTANCATSSSRKPPLARWRNRRLSTSAVASSFPMTPTRSRWLPP